MLEGGIILSYNNQASTLVSDYIIKQIKNGVWKPGDKIWSENDFCENLNVSRIAVRDAISSLVAISVLKKIKGSGTYVGRQEECSLEGSQFFAMSTRDVLDLMEFRLSLDPYCTGLFVERATEEDIAELEECYHNMIRSRNNLSEYNYYSNEYHLIISRCTRNSFIIKVSEFLRNNFQDHQNSLSDNMHKEKFQIGMIYHKKILDAIKERDKDMAVAYCSYHIRLSMKIYEKVIENKKSN